MSADCSNKITVSHDDPKVIERITKDYEPILVDGWDEENKCCDILLDVISPNEIVLIMSTWHSPPLPLLDHWVDLGCAVDCVFFEPSDWVVGVYKDKILCFL